MRHGIDGAGTVGKEWPMDIAAFVISCFALVVAGIGTYLSNKRSKEALAASERAATNAQWSAAQEAVQRLMAFDPTQEPVGERLANLRISLTALVDELPEWHNLGPWLDVERALGMALSRQVMDSATPSDSVDERLQKLEPVQTWAQAFSTNLRVLKSKGYDPDPLAKLTARGKEYITNVHRNNGWELPPERNPRLGTLD